MYVQVVHKSESNYTIIEMSSFVSTYLYSFNHPITSVICSEINKTVHFLNHVVKALRIETAREDDFTQDALEKVDSWLLSEYSNYLTRINVLKSIKFSEEENCT